MRILTIGPPIFPTPPRGTQTAKEGLLWQRVPRAGGTRGRVQMHVLASGGIAPSPLSSGTLEQPGILPSSGLHPHSLPKHLQVPTLCQGPGGVSKLGSRMGRRPHWWGAMKGESAQSCLSQWPVWGLGRAIVQRQGK